MKNLSASFLLFVILLFVSASVNATGIHRGFENCQITAVDDVIINKKIEKVWTLNYNPNESSVTVLKRKTVNGVEYVVRSPYFEVCYASAREGFGIKKLKAGQRCVNRRISSAVIDVKEMEHQRIITPNKVDDEFAVGLIASYLPDLLNDTYTHLLN